MLSILDTILIDMPVFRQNLSLLVTLREAEPVTSA